MTGLELDKLLNEALAKYGLSVKAVTKSSYMPATGVIMTPKGRRRGDIKDKTLKKTTREEEAN
tara:strand:- start:433 stop:621 length:189 start_codon:yes stop_codon:yes gene_type:complete